MLIKKNLLPVIKLNTSLCLPFTILLFAKQKKKKICLFMKKILANE